MKIHEAVAPIAPIKPAAPAQPAAAAPAQPAAAAPAQPAANPVATATQSTLDKLGARAGAAPGSNTQQVADAYEQKLLDRMGKRFGLPPGSTAEQVQAAQQAYLDKNDPAAAAQYKQNMTNIDAGNTAANTPVKLATPQAQQPAAAPGAAAPAAPAANPDDVGGQAAAKAGKSPIAIMLAQPTIGKNQAMLDVIAPTLGLPAGSSAEQILAADDARNKQAGNKYAAAPGAAQPVAEHYALDLLDYGKLVESQLDEVLSELYQTVDEGNDPYEPEAHDEFASDTYYDDEQGVAEGSLNEFAPGNNPGGGNYLKALASAWYNGTFNTGDLHKGIKSQEDVERILERGIHCGDGKIRKYSIGYNSDFDGVEIQSDDHYEYTDYDDAGNEIDSRTDKPWGPYDVVAFHDSDLDESISKGNKKPEQPEADYGDDYQAMVARVKKLAGLGPLKTVYDPAKRVYKNVPKAEQPKK